MTPAQAPGAEATDTDALIKQWRASARLAEQVAAELAAKIASGQMHAYQELPSLDALADEHDVTTRTISRAKRLLGDHGLLKLENGRYYVT